MCALCSGCNVGKNLEKMCSGKRSRERKSLRWYRLQFEYLQREHIWVGAEWNKIKICIRLLNKNRISEEQNRNGMYPYRNAIKCSPVELIQKYAGNVHWL